MLTIYDTLHMLFQLVWHKRSLAGSIKGEYWLSSLFQGQNQQAGFHGLLHGIITFNGQVRFLSTHSLLPHENCNENFIQTLTPLSRDRTFAAFSILFRRLLVLVNAYRCKIICGFSYLIRLVIRSFSELEKYFYYRVHSMASAGRDLQNMGKKHPKYRGL